ncbi:MAG: hypothetical protein HY329_16850 [Chloroflexi bacterium]|nr:hypothetical protein [Chloroflexota bacterium]
MATVRPRSLPPAERAEVLTGLIRDLGELAETFAKLSRDSRLDGEPTDCWLDLFETVCYLDRALNAAHMVLETQILPR